MSASGEAPAGPKIEIAMVVQRLWREVESKVNREEQQLFWSFQLLQSRHFQIEEGLLQTPLLVLKLDLYEYKLIQST